MSDDPGRTKFGAEAFTVSELTLTVFINFLFCD